MRTFIANYSAIKQFIKSKNKMNSFRVYDTESPLCAAASRVLSFTKNNFCMPCVLMFLNRIVLTMLN